MLAALGRRVIAGVAVVGGVVTLTFVLLLLAPGDPAQRLLGPTGTPAQLAAQRHALGLDRPVTAQFTTWVARAVRGDWGTSIATGRPVRALLREAWPATALLVGLSLLLSYAIGLAVGALQAARTGSRLDTALSVASVTLFALPGYWLGLMLVMVFTYWAGVLPAFGAAGLDADLLSGWPRITDQAAPHRPAAHHPDADRRGRGRPLCAGRNARRQQRRASSRPPAQRERHRRA